MARPQYGRLAADTSRSHWDGAEVGALLYAPRVPVEEGASPGCGVEHGSELDLELRRWATTAGCGTERTDAVRSIERKLRDLLREHGLMQERTRAPAVRRWTDPDGAVWSSVGPSFAVSAATA